MRTGTKLALAIFLVSCSSGAILGRSETQECVFYNASWEKDGTNRSGIESCYGETDKRRHCFSTWKNRSGTVEMVKQGCWLDDVNCYDSSECVERKENPDVFFCCCEGNMCNHRFLYSPETLQNQHMNTICSAGAKFPNPTPHNQLPATSSSSVHTRRDNQSQPIRRVCGRSLSALPA